MKLKLLFFSFLLLLSCVQKVCPRPENILKAIFKKPKEGVYYGYLKVNFLRIPVLIKKRGKREEVRVGYRGVEVSPDFLCYEGTCFELPVSPSEIIYGYFPGNYRVEKCNGVVVLKSNDGKELYLENGELKGVKYKNISLVYGKRTPEGYFKDIVIKINDFKVKLIIQGREVKL